MLNTFIFRTLVPLLFGLILLVPWITDLNIYFSLACNIITFYQFSKLVGAYYRTWYQKSDKFPHYFNYREGVRYLCPIAPQKIDILGTETTLTMSALGTPEDLKRFLPNEVKVSYGAMVQIWNLHNPTDRIVSDEDGLFKFTQALGRDGLPSILFIGDLYMNYVVIKEIDYSNYDFKIAGPVANSRRWMKAFSGEEKIYIRFMEPSALVPLPFERNVFMKILQILQFDRVLTTFNKAIKNL